MFTEVSPIECYWLRDVKEERGAVTQYSKNPTVLKLLSSLLMLYRAEKKPI